MTTVFPEALKAPCCVISCVGSGLGPKGKGNGDAGVLLPYAGGIGALPPNGGGCLCPPPPKSRESEGAFPRYDGALKGVEPFDGFGGGMLGPPAERASTWVGENIADFIEVIFPMSARWQATEIPVLR